MEGAVLLIFKEVKTKISETEEAFEKGETDCTTERLILT
jgi:hypothetical protein